MKKTALILSVMLVLTGAVLLFSRTAVAYSDEEKNTADALYSLSLFLGYGADSKGEPTYGLDDSLTREQGIILLLRMLGEAETAKECTYENPFSDTSAYSDRYIAYAYHRNLTKGTGKTTFSGTDDMTETMFLTFCLRALGYADTGENTDFQWDKAKDFAEKIGLRTAEKAPLTRGNTVCIFWSVLNQHMKNSQKTLAQTLIEKGVFTSDDFRKATRIQQGLPEEERTVDNSQEDETQEETVPETTEQTEEVTETEKITTEEETTITEETTAEETTAETEKTPETTENLLPDDDL